MNDSIFLEENHRKRQFDCSEHNIDSSLSYTILPFLLKETRKVFTSFLDIGSQEGQFAKKLNDTFNIKRTTCMDINETTVSNGEKKYPHFNWVLGDVTNWNTDETFDLISILNAFYALYSINVIKKLHSMLDKDGLVLISTGDLNFSKRNISDKDIVDSFEREGFTLKSINKIYEKSDAESSVHLCVNSWYTSFIFKK